MEEHLRRQPVPFQTGNLPGVQLDTKRNKVHLCCVCIACNSLLPLMPPEIASASRYSWSTCRSQHSGGSMRYVIGTNHNPRTRMYERFTFNGHAAVSEQRIVVRHRCSDLRCKCGSLQQILLRAVHLHITTLAVPQRTYMSSRSAVLHKQMCKSRY